MSHNAEITFGLPHKDIVPVAVAIHELRSGPWPFPTNEFREYECDTVRFRVLEYHQPHETRNAEIERGGRVTLYLGTHAKVASEPGQEARDASIALPLYSPGLRKVANELLAIADKIDSGEMGVPSSRGSRNEGIQP